MESGVPFGFNRNVHKDNALSTMHEPPKKTATSVTKAAA